MKRFLFVSIAFLGWAFYELSGGAEFEPAARAQLNAPETVVETESEATETIALATNISPEAPKDTETVNVAAALPIPEETKVSLEAIPTTRRLVGDSAPTPQAERIALGPTTIETDSEVDPSLSLASLAQPEADLRRVSGSRVNLRLGPGTSYSVVDTLSRGTEVEILQDPGSGWVKLQVLENGRIGWMSARLLVKVNG